MVCAFVRVRMRSGVPDPQLRGELLLEEIKHAPESLQFTSILPRTLLVTMVPFLGGRWGNWRE